MESLIEPELRKQLERPLGLRFLPFAASQRCGWLALTINEDPEERPPDHVLATILPAGGIEGWCSPLNYLGFATKRLRAPGDLRVASQEDEDAVQLRQGVKYWLHLRAVGESTAAVPGRANREGNSTEEHNCNRVVALLDCDGQLCCSSGGTDFRIPVPPGTDLVAVQVDKKAQCVFYGLTRVSEAQMRAVHHCGDAWRPMALFEVTHPDNVVEIFVHPGGREEPLRARFAISQLASPQVRRSTVVLDGGLKVQLCAQLVVSPTRLFLAHVRSELVLTTWPPVCSLDDDVTSEDVACRLHTCWTRFSVLMHPVAKSARKAKLHEGWREPAKMMLLMWGWLVVTTHVEYLPALLCAAPGGLALLRLAPAATRPGMVQGATPEGWLLSTAGLQPRQLHSLQMVVFSLEGICSLGEALDDRVRWTNRAQTKLFLATLTCVTMLLAIFKLGHVIVLFSLGLLLVQACLPVLAALSQAISKHRRHIAAWSTHDGQEYQEDVQ